MLKKKKICVVVPAYNEEKHISEVIQTMPAFVDLIIVIDDQSKDQTVRQAHQAAKKFHKKVAIIRQPRNRGVGAAIATGYKQAIIHRMDVTAVMAGDAQMAAEELKSIVLPVVKKEADYVKGNRLTYRQAWQIIPKMRYLGNSVLSLLTKIASGYWHVADSQTGYTAVSKTILEKIDLESLYPRYGFPNDMLVCLNVANARVKEIPIRPVYHSGGKSGIRLWKVVPTISWLLLRRFFWRLKVKYIIEDFHPLVFFYFLAIILFLASLFLLVRLIYLWVESGHIPPINALALVFCVIMTTQFLFFAMWFDMDYNKDLKVK
ncbi:ribonuclease BN [Candidatus Berkelbacteria bacterium RBG_13_40_8]|uniref:Ribonuclease BN n=1 Tax=Candidatus Berkelbacteria bacterium RBG_13_40_8 TaxID=1797467 RepID=A0A1F5DND4_9BACT|nr:MAG: ribonuclease BN [Candidatus Berkelbacteria bacterium RBG_13_40_8]